jgi:hypothetical protein
MSQELAAGIVGGLIGGVLGVVGTIASAYWGPRKLEEWRHKRLHDQLHGPRKKMLLTMLEDPRYADGRSLRQLCLTTGTSDEDCRRLLIEIGARGTVLTGIGEGWVLIKNKPLDQQ